MAQIRDVELVGAIRRAQKDEDAKNVLQHKKNLPNSALSVELLKPLKFTVFYDL